MITSSTTSQNLRERKEKKRKEKCKLKSKLPWLTITWKGDLELTLTKEVLNYGSFVVEVDSICFFLWII